MAKHHDPQALTQLLAELYVVVDTVCHGGTVLDQIMAAIDGEQPPYRSLLQFGVPLDNADLEALAAQRIQLQQLVEGRPDHPLATAISHLDAHLAAFGSSKRYPGKPAEYPVVIERDGDTWMASFPDVPEALTCADSEAEALAEAHDALVTAIEFYFEDRRPVPLPSKPQASQQVVQVPASLWSRVLLLNAGCDLPCCVPESGDEYDTRVEALDSLLRIVGEDENHPLAARIARLNAAIAAALRGGNGGADTSLPSRLPQTTAIKAAAPPRGWRTEN